jgi:hypothetical protein
MTYVLTDDLTPDAVLDAIAHGRTYAAQHGARLIEFSLSPGDHREVRRVAVEARVTFPLPVTSTKRFVVYRDGVPVPESVRTARAGRTTYVYRWTDGGPYTGEHSYVLRVSEVLITSPAYVYIRWDVSDRVRWDANGHEYQWFGTDTTWSEAKRQAEAMGGHLVTIASAEENEWVRSQLLVGAVADGHLNTWIGLYQDPAGSPPPANWHWVTGEPVRYTNWRPAGGAYEGEPNDLLRPETCGEMDKDDSGYWNDNKDDGDGWRHGFVVEWEPR